MSVSTVAVRQNASKKSAAGNAREFLDSEKCDSGDVWINLATESHAAREEAAQIEAKRAAALKEGQLFEAAWHAASEERENYEAKKSEAIEERENFEAKFGAFS